MRARVFQSGLFLAAAVMAATPSIASADDDYPGELASRDDALRLEPISPWNLDFGTNRCRLARMFGTEDDRHLLMFEQAAPNGEFGVTFAGSSVSWVMNSRRLYIGMKHDEEMERLERFARADIPNIGPAIILTSHDIDSSAPRPEYGNAGLDLDEAAKVERIVLRDRSRVLSFETDNMMPAFQALNSCTSDLLRDWGLDPDLHQSYAPPQWTNQSAITRRIVDNYPRTALNAGEQAIFRMRVIVETDGRVSDCFLESSTEVSQLESPACNAMMRARFEPARTQEGDAMRSFYASTVSYVIGG